MRLEDIGFYTLSDKRARQASVSSDLQRCELILTGRCNFRCPYCRAVGGPDLEFSESERTIHLWCAHGLENIRFSGGEPTLYKRLTELVRIARDAGVIRIAVSTNGSADAEVYQELLDSGVNDFSISLDACCAEDGDRMSGGIKGAWARVIENIRWLSKRTYVTVGVVLTQENEQKLCGTLELAKSLVVSDIRVIPAAQYKNRLGFNRGELGFNLSKHPILNYRLAGINMGARVRGLSSEDNCRCALVLDDVACMGGDHYPCIIYMREGGQPIGKMNGNFRRDREEWFKTHDTHKDKICASNCLDVCRDYNNRWRELHVA